MIFKQLFIKKKTFGLEKAGIREKKELVRFVRNQFKEMSRKNLVLPVQVIKL